MVRPPRHGVQHDLVNQSRGHPLSAYWAMLIPPTGRTSFPSATARACSTVAATLPVTNI